MVLAMPKFVVENLTQTEVVLAVEPWAMAERLAPNETAEFQYDEPAEVAFSITGAGPAVSITSDRVIISANGKTTSFIDRWSTL